jgi:hypothetical protein
MFRPLATEFKVISSDPIELSFMYQLLKDNKIEIVSRDGNVIGWCNDEDTKSELLVLFSKEIIDIIANFPLRYFNDELLTFEDFRDIENPMSEEFIMNLQREVSINSFDETT